MDPIMESFQRLKEKILAASPNADLGRLISAFNYAEMEHKGQLRKSGEPYITHPLAVAEIVAELGLDMESILAALLHDVVEDTPATRAQDVHGYGQGRAGDPHQALRPAAQYAHPPVPVG